MKTATLMPGILLGLSTFLLSAQPQIVPSEALNTLPTGVSAKETASEQPAEQKKPDVNKLIQTSTVFTNSVGMVLKKSGGLWVAAHETTQEAYEKVTSSNPSVFRGAKRPVDSVSWNASVAFCTELTKHEKANEMLPDGYRYALPTQQQWESLANGVSLEDAVTSLKTRRSGTASVGSLRPNASGIYDLRGNVAEWCADPADGAFRVLRGGSWEDWIELNLRPAFRIYAAPTDAQNTYGFRCVLIQDR